MSSNIHTSHFHIGDREVAPTWESYDFSDDVAGIPNVHIQSVLTESGVMYIVQADPKIRVSSMLDIALQGYSAAHEELCMEQKVAECSEVEGMVIDAIADEDLQSEFISMRLRMFGALCLMDKTNEQFAATRELLVHRSA